LLCSTANRAGTYQVLGSTIEFDRINGLGQPIAKLSAFVSRFSWMSPRAICSALKTQSSLEGMPHRAQRSQSPQLNSTGRCTDRSALAILSRMDRTTVAGAGIFFSPYIRFSGDLIAQRGPDCIDQDQLRIAKKD
jgi:hypothetical protein